MHELFERSRVAFWAASLGLIVLFLFLVAFAGLGLSQVTWLSIVVLVLMIAFAIHAIRLGRMLRESAAGDMRMRALNRLRERRGF